MPPMNEDEIKEFLGERAHTAKVATTRQDGRPHVAPVWFVLDGDDVLFTTGADTVKGKTLARDRTRRAVRRRRHAAVLVRRSSRGS